MLLCSQAVLLTFTVQKCIVENKRKKLAEAFEGGASGTSAKRWSKFVFSGYDFSLHGQAATSDQRLAVAEQLTVMRAEDEAVAASSSRSTQKTVLLYLRRLILGVLYLAVQGAGW